MGITSSDVHSANGFSVERRQPDGYCENDIEDVFDMFEDAHFLEENECNSEYMITEADGFGDEDTMSFEHEQQNIGEDEEEYFEELQPISDDDSSNLWTQVNDELSNPGNQSSFIGKNLDGHTRSQATNNAHHVNNTNNIPAQTNSLERALDSNIQVGYLMRMLIYDYHLYHMWLSSFLFFVFFCLLVIRNLFYSIPFIISYISINIPSPHSLQI